MSLGETQSRAALAVLVSVFLHGVLFFWLRGVSVETTAASPAPLNAQLHAPQTASPPQLSTPHFVAQEKPRVFRVPSPKPQAESAQIATVVPALASSGTSESVAAISAPPQDEAPTFDPLWVGRYRAALLAAVGRDRVYPYEAKQRNMEGTVEMRLDFAEGRLKGMVVVRSSGHPLLDEIAMDRVRKAQAEVPLPPHLREQDFSVEKLAIIYRLEDAESN